MRTSVRRGVDAGAEVKRWFASEAWHVHEFPHDRCAYACPPGSSHSHFRCSTPSRVLSRTRSESLPVPESRSATTHRCLRIPAHWLHRLQIGNCVRSRPEPPTTPAASWDRNPWSGSPRSLCRLRQPRGDESCRARHERVVSGRCGSTDSNRLGFRCERLGRRRRTRANSRSPSASVTRESACRSARQPSPARGRSHPPSAGARGKSNLTGRTHSGWSGTRPAGSTDTCRSPAARHRQRG